MSLANDWTQLPDGMKLHLRNRLAEACTERGLSISSITSPGQLAIEHDPTQVQRPHLEVIDDALTSLLSGDNDRLIITTPPQVGKSFRVSRWFPFWWLTMRPHDQVVLCSYAASLAHTHTAATRDLVTMYGAQHGLRLREGAARQSDWRISAGGSMRGSGVKGGITGQPMDLGIIDDPYRDRAEADSPTIRAARWDWYSSAFSTRMSPHARVAVVLTRWHKDDLVGRLLDRDGRVEEGGRWIVVHLPAIAVAPNPMRGFYRDALGREPGEPLTHPKIDADDTAALLVHWTNRRNDATSRDWTSMFQGSPVDAEGALLTEGDIVNATGTPGEPRRIAVGIDPSGSGDRDTAGIVAGMLDDNGKTWFTHDRTAKMTSLHWSREACLLAYEVDATRFVVEVNFGGDMATDMLTQAWENLQREELIPVDALCPLVQAVHARRSKVLRAEPIAQGIKTGRCGFASGADLATLRSEWTQWEPGSTWSPGALDAAVHLASELMPPIQRVPLTEAIADITRDEVQAVEGSIAAMRMR
ncbi:hypothetical protein HH308_06220 [Gordonia sp. TBRC 11910]|uniref:Terminase n=1 Tax=Gordonia asplenii TaxID=2725283 RepID=A0A848KS60_9ACTN|nr:terminase family protein [Gordonia asplenii]NMO00807.1 hypothetical protein [Gordonia asplenii]